MKEGERLAMAVLWTDGNVMTFDARGVHMPDFQGRFGAVRQSVVEAADADTEFWLMSWWERTNGRSMTAREWLEEGERRTAAVPGPPH